MKLQMSRSAAQSAFAGKSRPVVSTFRSRAWMLALVLVAAGLAQAQINLGTTPVGLAAGETNISVTAQLAGTVNRVLVVSAGAVGTEFTAGIGTATCASASLAKSQQCIQSVIFTPAAPGLRMGAVVLLDGNNNVLGTTPLTGTGVAGLGVMVPGVITTVAGDGDFQGVLDGNPAVFAELNLPSSVTMDGAGNLYIADTAHQRIRMVCAGTTATIAGATCAGAGIISTIAGNGNTGFTGDGGPASSATLNSPSGIAMDGAGNLYIADTGNNCIRKITAANGNITTLAGSTAGTAGFSGDGAAATAAQLNAPQGVTLAGNGNLYIADTGNHRIRMVSATTGIITTVAGNGTAGYAGDGGPATGAELNYPYTVAFGPSGQMYIPDSVNNRIRLVNPTTGVISTFAGTGQANFTGDGGPAASATLYSPLGVAVDANGNVYIADTQNFRIRKVSSSGTITTIAGNGGEISAGDGFGAQWAGLDVPWSLYLDAKGNLFIAGHFDNRIREIQANQAMLNYSNYSGMPVRQGSQGTTTMVQTVENDGNAPLDLTQMIPFPAPVATLDGKSITFPGPSAVLDQTATTCAFGSNSSQFLAVDADCVIGVIFAPSANPFLPLDGQPHFLVDDPEYQVGKSGDTINSPLYIQVSGSVTAANSTTLTLVSSQNPSGFGQSVTFTATVATGAGTGNLTGTVTFYDGSTTLQSGVAVNAGGVATFSSSTLAVGVHSITAAYGGDSAHFGSTSTALSQTIVESTATALTSSQNPSATGASVTFTATVAVSDGGTIAPDGTVTFTDGSATLTTVPINAKGLATYTTSTLTIGNHAIVATYSGDPANQILGSVSSTLNQDVQNPASAALASSPNPSSYGTAVTFTATITTSGGPAPTGTVNFLDGAQQIGTGTVTAGVANFSTATLAVGSHSVTAAYQGDTNYAPGTSPVLTQVVSAAKSATALTAAPNPGIAGNPVTLTATVTEVGGAASATGTITFTDGSTTLGTATLNASGVATINPTLATGQHSIVASYSGDQNLGASASSPLALTVSLATTTAVVTAAPNPSVVLGSVTFTAKVTGNGVTPTGTVTFISDGATIGTGTLDNTGTATLSYAGLSAGNHSVTASYAGDANNAASTSAAITQVVGLIATGTYLGTASTSGANPQSVLVATIVGASGPTPTGTVTFNSGTTVIGSAPLNASGVATLTPSLAPGNYTITATYGGDALHSPSTSASVTITGTATGFSLTVTPATVTLATSQNGIVTVTLASNNGFTDTIGLGCGSLPTNVTCNFSAVTAKLPANGTTTVQLTIDTNQPLGGGTTARNQSGSKEGRGIALATLLLPLSLFFGWSLRRFRKRYAWLSAASALLLLSGVLAMGGCASFTVNSAAPGTYTIQVTGVGANSDISHYQNVTLNITK